MNDLFSPTLARFRNEQVSKDNHHHVIQMTETSPSTDGVNLDKFFAEVESIKEELKEMERLNQSLRGSHEHSKTVHHADTVKELWSCMDANVALALKKAKLIKVRLEALDRSNEANRNFPSCGPGSSSDRTRTSVVSGLRKKLKDSMDSFNSLREKISSEYRETVKRRYYTVTGEDPDDKTIDLLISTGESETFLQKAIRQQGRASVVETVREIQERHDAARAIERNLNELHHVFMDMALLVHSQAHQLEDIESHLARANSFVRSGVHQLHGAKNHQKNTRKSTCFAVILLLLVILIILLPIVLRK